MAITSSDLSFKAHTFNAVQQIVLGVKSEEFALHEEHLFRKVTLVDGSEMILKIPVHEILQEAVSRSKFSHPTTGIDHAYVIADETYSIRALDDLMRAITKITGSSHQMLKALGTTGAVYDSSGITTAGNSLIGMLCMLKSWNVWDKAQKLEDREGVLQAEVAFATATTQAIAGALYLAYRPLSLCALLTNVPVKGFNGPNLLGNATYACGCLGNAFFGAFYALQAAGSLQSLHEGRAFAQEYAAAQDKLAFLQGKLKVGSEEVDQVDSRKEVIQVFTDRLEAYFAALQESGMKDIPRLSRKKMEELVETYALTGVDVDTLGKEFAHARLTLGKEKVLGRLTSSECVALIKKGDPTAPQKVEAAMKKNAYLQLAIFLVCALGCIATVLSFFYLVGVGALVVAAAFVIVALSMAAIDGYCLHQDFNGAPSKYDFYMLYASVVVGVLAIASSLVLTLVFFPITILPLAMTALFGTLWMVTNLITYIKMTRALRKDQEKGQPQADLQAQKTKIQNLFYNLRPLLS